MRRPHAWPLESETNDSFDEPISGLGYDDYLVYAVHGESLSRERYQALARLMIHDLARGHVDEKVASQLLVNGEVVPCLPPELWTPCEAPEPLEGVAAINLDCEPAAGNDSPDLFLGVWSQSLSISDLESRRAFVVATALGAFILADGASSTPWSRFRLGKPKRTASELLPIRSIWSAPLSLYRLQPVEEHEWILSDLFAMPGGPTRVSVDHGRVAIIGEAPSIGFMGRVCVTKRGAEVAMGFGIDALPSPQLLNKWIKSVLYRTRLTNRRLSLAQLQRDRGHLLTRRVMEWLWFNSRRG